MQDSGWIEAGDLVKGNSIVTRTGAPMTVTGLQWQHGGSGTNNFTVYNLVVDDEHTYFAGGFNGGLWVHNCNLQKNGRISIEKPTYENPGQHDPTNPQQFRGRPDDGILPSDAESTFKNAIPDVKGGNSYGPNWYGKNATGVWYRYAIP